MRPQQGEGVRVVCAHEETRIIGKFETPDPRRALDLVPEADRENEKKGYDGEDENDGDMHCARRPSG